MLVSTTLHFATGSIVADSQEPASGLMVITSGSVAVEIPHSSVIKSDSEAGVISQGDDGSKSLLYVFMRGCVFFFQVSFIHPPSYPLITSTFCPYDYVLTGIPLGIVP
jgi:hypothetical protein